MKNPLLRTIRYCGPLYRQGPAPEVGYIILPLQSKVFFKAQSVTSYAVQDSTLDMIDCKRFQRKHDLVSQGIMYFSLRPSGGPLLNQ